MKVRYTSVELLLLMALFAVFGCLFLNLIGQDALAEKNSFQFFSDSNTYLMIYNGDADVAGREVVGISNNYLGPLLVLNALSGNIYLVMLLNIYLFSHSLLKITSLLKIDSLTVAALLALSPLTASSLLAVNKELFIFPFIAFALMGFMRRSLLCVLIALCISILVRWQVTLFYLVMIGLSLFRFWYPRRRKWGLLALLLTCSALFVLLMDFLTPVLDVVERSLMEDETPGGGSYTLLNNLQEMGLYFLVFPFKAAHLLFAKGTKISAVFAPINVYNDIFVGLHSTVTLCIFLLLVWRRKFSLRSDLIFASVVFLAVFCLSPIYAPRYLYPVYVAWVLVLAGAPDNLRRLTRAPVRPSTQLETVR